MVTRTLRGAEDKHPYRTTSDPTYGVTTYTYDALGRTTLIQHPDNSTIQTNYTGRATQVTDEGNGTKQVQRISQTDALGRLTSVCEVSGTTLGFGTSNTPVSCGQDISGTGFLTTYSYDALANLLSVTQGALNPRSFSYDSLSRLTQAVNPESQATNYAYDVNGNVATKTAPKENQTNPSVTVNTLYTYDPLNRLTGKSYTDGTTTPASFQYDICPSTGCPTGYPSVPNATGRLVEAFTANTASFSSYDPMGRVNNEYQCTPENCSSGYFPVAYVYDLLGNATSYTNGVGTTFTQSFNTASQLTGVTSSWNDAQHPGTLLSNPNYNALGDLASATLGNGLTESYAYSKRTWLQSGAVTTTSSSDGTYATGSVTVGGTEKSITNPATQATGNITFTGINSNTQSVTVGTYTANLSVPVNQGTNVLAQAAASGLNGHLVTAYSSGSTVYLTSIVAGTAGNYSISVSGAYANIQGMSGGTNSSTTYDAGSASITVNGFVASATYGNGSTSSMLATALASSLNGANSPVTASSAGSVVSFTSKTVGACSDFPLLAASLSNNPSQFNPPSFSTTASGANMTGGSGTCYTFALTYAPDGDVLAANDSVNGNWTYGTPSGSNIANGYDDFNRLVMAVQTGQPAYTYAYDRYGNRWQHTYNGSCLSGTSSCVSFDANNRVSGGPLSYDAAGNVTADSMNSSYTYDAENRLTQVNGGTTATYVYDANGQRVRKTTATGSVDYIYDLAGHQVAEVNSSGGWNRGEVYAGGRHLATYSNSTTYFNHIDWLGTERMRTGVSGSISETCTSLPFGDNLNCTGGDPSPMHFTGKQRDPESGLDDFGARYDSSSMARFMTPDWSAAPMGVPYAEFGDPQSLNLYAYVRNNPATRVDKDGHCLPWCVTIPVGAVVGAAIGAAGETASELIGGKSFKNLDSKKIEHAAIGGAITGAVTGLAGPEAGALTKAGLTVGGSVLGGAVERKMDGEKVLSGKEIAKDVIAGAIGAKSDEAVDRTIVSTGVQAGVKTATALITDVGNRQLGVAARLDDALQGQGQPRPNGNACRPAGTPACHPNPPSH